MAFKKRIIDDLGEDALLLPAAVNDALQANDRVKYLFTLLQNAVSHADNPEARVSGLHKERLACGIDVAALDEVVANSRRHDTGTYAIPSANVIVVQILTELDTMLAPLARARNSGLSRAAGLSSERLRERLDLLAAELGTTPDSYLHTRHLDLITSGLRDRGDSLHLLVMDLHKELNRLQTVLAGETLAGAGVYLIADTDRPLVRAFMDGLNRTAPLKFDHPGLGTTATRVGDRLIIQNDIGMTDAHVLVIHVSDLTVAITYTDIHPERMEFFVSCFEPFAMEWNELSTGTDERLEAGNYFLRIGRYTAGDPERLQRFLEFAGSRLVFLIDWNRARKQLRSFVKNRDAIDLLTWAAAKDHGHRGFLVLGGEKFINQAIEYAARSAIHYGQPLHEVLGREQANSYLRFVLEKSSTGLCAGQSERLLRDEIKTELLKYFHTPYQSVMTVAGRHAEIIHDLANTTLTCLLRATDPDAAPFLQRSASRCRQWEHHADDLLNEARALIRSSTGISSTLRDVLELADDAADNLEETAYLLTLLTEAMKDRNIFATLRQMAEQIIQASQEYIKCLDSAKHVHRAGAREDLDDFLQAVDRIVKIEHDSDDAQREITAAIVRDVGECRQVHLYSELARTLEETTDALAISSLKLREHVLDEIMAG